MANIQKYGNFFFAFFKLKSMQNIVFRQKKVLKKYGNL